MATTITPGTTPIPYTYGGHTYWLMPDGHWANAKDGSGKVPQSAITAILAGQGVQQNGYGGTGTEPPGSTGSSAGPVWNPTPIPTSYQGGASYNGTIVIDPKTGARSYSIGYGDLRTPLGSGVTTTPTPTTGGTGSGTGGQSGGSTGGAGGSGSGSGGSAGGYGHGNPGNTGTGGDNPSAGYHGGNSGFGGMNGGSAVEHALAGHDSGAGSGSSGGSAAGSDEGGWFDRTNYNSGLINIGPVGSALMRVASQIPGPAGWAATGLGLAGRAYNVAQVDAIRKEQGIPGLSLGQVVGAFIPGLGNDYGALGGATIANPEQFQQRLDSLYGPAKSLGYSPLNPQYAETDTGSPYDPGIFQKDVPAWSYQNTQALLRGVKDPNYWGILDPNLEGSIPNVEGAPAPKASPVAAALAAPPANVYRSDGTVLGTVNDPAAMAAVAAGRASIGAGAGAPGYQDPNFLRAAPNGAPSQLAGGGARYGAPGSEGASYRSGGVF